MRIRIENKVSLVLILVAGASLVSMLATLRIDSLVNHTLYNYGLQFNYSWAIQYWIMAGIVFSMGWLIILTSIAFELHLLRHWLRKPPKPETPKGHQEPAQLEAPRTEAASTEKPEEEEVGTTLAAVKGEGELGEFQVLQEEPVENEAPRTGGATGGHRKPVQKKMPKTETALSEEPEEQEAEATKVAVKPEDRSGELRVPQEEPGQNERPRTEAASTEKPEDKEVKTTALAVKGEGELGEFRVLGEMIEMTDAKVARQKAENKPKNEE
jgi:hypothetical protein